jgi:hypothetical protein
MKQKSLPLPLQQIGLFFILAFLLVPSGRSSIVLAEPPCISLVQRAGSTQSAHWDTAPKSLGPVVANNLALLFGVETVNALSGWEHAYDFPSFWVNTALDVTMTATTHSIATRRLPEFIPTALAEALQGKRGQLTRSTLNGTLATLMTWGFWFAAASAQGKQITPDEMASAAVLCYSFYVCVQFVKTQIFIETPRRLDRRLNNKLLEQYGEHWQSMEQALIERARELNLTEAEAKKRLIGAFEKSLWAEPWEQHLPDAWQKVFEKELQAIADAHHKERPRRQLIKSILRYVEKVPGAQEELSQILHLGDPLSPQESFQIWKQLMKRSSSHLWLVRTGAFVDQVIGGLAGGILLRGLTQQALQD